MLTRRGKKLKNSELVKFVDTIDKGELKGGKYFNVGNIWPSKYDVKENSFCYIGYDDGQRVCTNAFEGDTCMSGQIFPKMDICINPRLMS